MIHNKGYNDGPHGVSLLGPKGDTLVGPKRELLGIPRVTLKGPKRDTPDRFLSSKHLQRLPLVCIQGHWGLELGVPGFGKK